ncbi:MAG: hypothetical protein OEZ39_05385 [Gammaproteobacteria bacterium]|nr:hypothetical protein [Gammaproteobacteria bacterium]
MYYKLETDIYQDYGIIEDPVLPDGVYFNRGTVIDAELELPLKFETNCDDENPPLEYMAGVAPVCSKLMLDALQAAGIDNIQTFPAILTTYANETVWDGYFALNIIGKVSAADMEKSKFVSIGEWPGGTPFAGFQNLVIDKNKTHDLYLFRLAECPSEIIIHKDIIDKLLSAPPPKGWGIVAFELEQT